MAIINKTQLKAWFANFLKPTQEQFWNWMDSYWHKQEQIPTTSIEGWDDFLASLPDFSALTNYLLKDGSNLTEEERLLLIERLKALTYDYETEDGTVYGTGYTKEQVDDLLALIEPITPGVNTGNASTYATLPTTRIDSSALQIGDWAVLKINNGTHKKGIYQWNGFFWAIISSFEYVEMNGKFEIGTKLKGKY